MQDPTPTTNRDLVEEARLLKNEVGEFRAEVRRGLHRTHAALAIGILIVLASFWGALQARTASQSNAKTLSLIQSALDPKGQFAAAARNTAEERARKINCVTVLLGGERSPHCTDVLNELRIVYMLDIPDR